MCMSPNRKLFVVLPAAGCGQRFGAALPKQFQNVLERPIISYTLDIFLQNASVFKIYVLVDSEFVGEMNKIVQNFHPKQIEKIRVTVGANYRHKTIAASISTMKSDNIEEDDLVLVHDAVRPLCSQKLLESVIKATVQYQACGVTRPLVSTVIKVEDFHLTESLDRSACAASEMPQCFKFRVFRNMYEQCNENDLTTGTECLLLAMKYGKVKPYLLQAAEDLFKITYPRDLDSFRLIVNAQNLSAAHIVCKEDLWDSKIVNDIRSSFTSVTFSSSLQNFTFNSSQVFSSQITTALITKNINCHIESLLSKARALTNWTGSVLVIVNFGESLTNIDNYLRLTNILRKSGGYTCTLQIVTQNCQTSGLFVRNLVRQRELSLTGASFAL